MSANKVAKDRAYYAANRERIKARMAQYRKENPEKIRSHSAKYAAKHKDEINRKALAWKAANPDRYKAAQSAAQRRRYVLKRDEILAKARADHHANREKRLAQKRAWASQFPEKGASYTAQRR